MDGATTFTLSLPNRGVLLGFLTVGQLLDAAAAADASDLFGAVSVGDNLLEKPRIEVVALRAEPESAAAEGEVEPDRECE